jgi:hypothetical protein
MAAFKGVAPAAVLALPGLEDEAKADASNDTADIVQAELSDLQPGKWAVVCRQPALIVGGLLARGRRGPRCLPRRRARSPGGGHHLAVTHAVCRHRLSVGALPFRALGDG